MGVIPRRNKLQLNYEEEVRRKSHDFFSPQLSRLNLSEQKINNQKLEELKQSLEIVNGALQEPNSFGTFRYKFNANGGLIVVTQDQTHYHAEIGVLPILLERKKSILEKIKIINEKEKIENLREIFKEVPEGEIRNKLEKELVTLEKTTKEIQKEEKKLELAEEEEELKLIQSKNELELARVEIFERRSKVWRSFLERESASTILGGILLFIITICQLVAMFTQIETTQIINNAFLLILGYFFGTTVSKVNKE